MIHSRVILKYKYHLLDSSGKWDVNTGLPLESKNTHVHSAKCNLIASQALKQTYRQFQAIRL